MDTDQDTTRARRWYADELRVAAPIQRNKAIVQAFATVPRERFLGPGPWRLMSPSYPDVSYMTPDANPHWVYHNVLVAIDESRQLNNGAPALWARLFDQADIAPGNRILQVGAGTGYYTAVLAEIVGHHGQVVAVEHDAGLASSARRALEPWPQVELVCGDGTQHDPGEIDVIVAFAGVTHPAPLWLDRLAEGGRLLVPLTTESRLGFFLRVLRRHDKFKADSLGPCGFFPCIGARDTAAAERLAMALRSLRRYDPIPVDTLHRGEPSPTTRRHVWYEGPGFWLSAGESMKPVMSSEIGL